MVPTMLRNAPRPARSREASPELLNTFTVPAVPPRYRQRVAMNLRLTDEETAALRQRAADEGRSMQDVARSAIREYVSGRPARLAAAIERIRTEDAELLDRLSQ
jgi:plasmid stability protein